MKKFWIAIPVVLIVLGLAYLGRHQIKSLFMGSSSTTQVAQDTTTTSASVPSDNIYLTKTDPA